MLDFRTIFRNIGANSMTMGIILLFQLLSVPIFLRCWGVKLYGEWLVLNALTAYFQMTDIGLNTATGNKVSFHYVRKEYQHCDILLNNNIFFIIGAFLVAFVALFVLGMIDFFPRLFKLELIEPEVIYISLIILLLQVFVGTFNNFLNTVYRATNCFARGIMIDNVIRICENFVLLVGVATGMSIPTILSLGVVVKLFGIVVKFRDSRNYYRFSIGIRHVRLSEIRAMMVPALSFVSLPIANSVVFQGFTLMVNFLMGTVAVVVFNTTRTLVNFTRSVIDILHRSIWPEVSLAYGRNDLESLRQMHRYTVLSSLGVAALASLFLVVFGDWIYTVWTAHRMGFDSTLFGLLIVTILVNTIWASSSIILQSTNNHNVLCITYLSLAIVSIAFGYCILLVTRSISYLPLAFVVMDLSLVAYVIRKSCCVTEDTYRNFLRAMTGDAMSIPLLIKPRK